MNKTIQQIIKNVITGWGVVGLQAVIGLVLVPFLLGKMGREGYGAVGILLSIIGFAEIADLGLRQALNRELSEKVAQKDTDGFRRLASSALILYVLIALAVGGMGAVFAPELCGLFKVGDEYVPIMTLLLRTYAPMAVLLSFVIPVFSAGICSHMRYDVQNNVSMFAQLLVSLLLFVCLSVLDFHPLLVWCGVRAVGEIFRLGLMAVFYSKICDGGKLGARYICWKSLVPLFQLGGSMYVLQLTNVLSQRMDPLIISRFIGLGGVALYQAGSRLPQMVNPIVMAAVNQLTPLTTKYHVGDNQKREQQVLIFGTKYTLYFGAFFVVGMVLFADSFCHLWLFKALGDDVKTVVMVFKMWAFASLFQYAGGVHWPISLGKKRIKFAVWICVWTSIFNVLLSFYLVGYTSLGVPGVLVGTMICELLRRVLSVWYVSKICGLRMSAYIRQSYLIPVFFMLCIYFLGSIFVVPRHISSWGELFVWGGGYSICVALVLLVIELKTFIFILRRASGGIP